MATVSAGRWGWIACAAVMALGGCRTAPVALDPIAEGYVRTALQLAQHQPSLVDGYHGPEDWRPGPREPVAAIRARIQGLQKALEAARGPERPPDDEARAAYLAGQLGALDLAARRLLGESFAFADEVRLSFGVPLRAPDAAAMAATRATLDSLLPGTGPLPDRYRAFRLAHALSPDAVKRVFTEALDICRQTVAGHVALPAGEAITLRWLDQGPWAAYARHSGELETEIRATTSGGPTAAQLAHVACHEGYGGHHLQHVLIASALVAGRGWLELSLAPAFGPHLLIAEGAADVGARLALDARRPSGVDADERRIETAVADLDQAIPSIVAAYLDGSIPQSEAAARLAGEALVLDPENFLGFASVARTRAVAYPLGRPVVQTVIGEAASDAEAWARLAALFSDAPFMLRPPE